MKSRLAIILALAAMMTGCIAPIPPTITAVTAFYGDERTVEFHVYADTDELMYVWDTGDGGQEVGQDPLHEYAAYGKYNVTVRATDSRGQWVEFTVPVHVTRGRVCFYEGAVEMFPWACTYPLGVRHDGGE